MEVLVSLAVIGVAATIILSLFQNTMMMGTRARSGGIAASLAEERLIDMKVNPGNYDWSAALNAVDKLTAVKAKDGSTGFPPPATEADQKRAASRDKVFYEKFTWEAYAKQGQAGAPYLELTAVVRWRETGRQRRFALTSIVPRLTVEGAQ